MDDMDDETFNMYIATDDGIDSGKENENSNLPRQPKTTQRQFDMISDFMKCKVLISNVEWGTSQSKHDLLLQVTMKNCSTKTYSDGFGII